jgi:ubiquinone/menaquinone biosynthesis C-methylase UbiE
MNIFGEKHVCPVWIGHILCSPIRKLIQDPRAILAPHVTPGMCAMDIGPGMGFFSLPLAELVGQGGRVICVDLQQGMLDALLRRARRVNLGDRIEPRLCTLESLAVDDLAGRIDFALAFAMVHEVGDPSRLFAQIRAALKPAGRLLFAEPKGHVTVDAFAKSVAAAEAAGFRSICHLRITRSHAVLLERS